MRSVIVLGAGIVGVASALHLQRRGWSVVLVDRKSPGRETSYGNTGIIQSEAIRPYPMPRDLASLAAIAMRRTNDVHYSVASLPRHIGPLLRYWWHSAPERHRRISQSYARIIAQAAAEHAVLIAEAGADALVRRKGYRTLHRTQAAMDRAALVAEALAAEHGVRSQIVGPAQLAAAEPGLNETGAGAIHWLDPWSVSDPGGLVSAYADLFRRAGGTFVNGDAGTLAPGPGGGWTVDTVDGRIDAEAAVVALGPWSPDLLRQFGYRFPMVRKRGYHLHFNGGGTLDLPLQDPAFGYVLAPMSKGLRITTGRRTEWTVEVSAPDPARTGRADGAGTCRPRRTRSKPNPGVASVPVCPTCCRSWDRLRSTRDCGCISGTAIRASRLAPQRAACWPS